MAGHSKWAQIKHKKAITDVKKGRLFSRAVREIMVSVKQGGAKMDMNPRLRTATERARSIGLPKDNIERAIERASGGGEGASLSEFLYEATAPGGAAILIEGTTDSKNRTLAEIKHLLIEHNARLADPGSLLWGFEKVGTFVIHHEDNKTKSNEEIELGIIESGAKDFSFQDAFWEVEIVFSERDKVRSFLERKGILIREAGHKYKARTMLTLGEKDRAGLETLLDRIADHDDVQEIYTNLNS